jgi:hypothetical protein
VKGRVGQGEDLPGRTSPDCAVWNFGALHGQGDEKFKVRCVGWGGAGGGAAPVPVPALNSRF